MFEAGVGQVIEGWDKTIMQMTEGEKCRVTIPYRLAYGESGYPPAIPPRANLTFEIDFMGIAKRSTSTHEEEDAEEAPVL